MDYYKFLVVFFLSATARESQVKKLHFVAVHAWDCEQKKLGMELASLFLADNFSLSRLWFGIIFQFLLEKYTFMNILAKI